tara:strand:+ start:499 stop:858 length:360 start_codon:yes stop_codon:yes gene_type:complete
MQVIKITAVGHEGNPDFFTAIVIQTSKKQIVDYGHFGSTKHTWLSNGIGVNCIHITPHDHSIHEYDIHDPNFWKYFKRISEDNNLIKEWFDVPDTDKKSIKFDFEAYTKMENPRAEPKS